jgi:RNA polymerase sigma-70 factor (ECF subfamily)
MVRMQMPFDQTQPLADDALLVLYAQGDAQAAAILTRRLLPRVLAQSQRMLGDAAEAEDVAQDALIRLWKIAPDWRAGEAKVTTWLYRVTANLCVDLLRKRRGVGLDDVAEPVDPDPGMHSRLMQQSRRDALQDALDQLPLRQRQAVVLRHIEELSNPEIAQIMDITPRAVESLSARGKRNLADLLAGRQAELGYADDDIAG